MDKKTSKTGPEQDAKGQYAPSQADGKSSGVASAKPTVITGSEDATEHRGLSGEKKSGKDWDVNFDDTADDKS